MIDPVNLPVPNCRHGYPADQLADILGKWIDRFRQWHEDQTGTMCDGRAYDYDAGQFQATGCGPHGPAVYQRDVRRFAEQIARETPYWDAAWILVDGRKPDHCCADAYESAVDNVELKHTTGCHRRCSMPVLAQSGTYPCAITIGHAGACRIHPHLRSRSRP